MWLTGDRVELGEYLKSQGQCKKGNEGCFGAIVELWLTFLQMPF